MPWSSLQTVPRAKAKSSAPTVRSGARKMIVAWRGKEAPAELAVGLLARDLRPGFVGVGRRALIGALPVLPLDAEVELGGVGFVVALESALVVVLLLLLLARAGLGGGGGVGGAELVLVEAHDAAEGDGVRGGSGRTGLGGGADLRPHG